MPSDPGPGNLCKVLFSVDYTPRSLSPKLRSSSSRSCRVRSHQNLRYPTSVGQRKDRLRAKGSDDHPEVRHLPSEGTTKMQKISQHTQQETRVSVTCECEPSVSHVLPVLGRETDRLDCRLTHHCSRAKVRVLQSRLGHALSARVFTAARPPPSARASFGAMNPSPLGPWHAPHLDV